MRLQDCNIGDTVVLQGYAAPASPLVICSIDSSGHRLLWLKWSDFMAGKRWDVSAAGSHPAIRQEK